MTSNYYKDYIPYTSLEKAFDLIGMKAEKFMKEEKNETKLEIEDIFEEFIC